MAKEVDINSTIVVEVTEDGPIPIRVEPGQMEHYQTDVDFNLTVFLNPVYWLRIHGFWDELNGYGFILGPFCVRVNVHKLVRFKDETEK